MFVAADENYSCKDERWRPRPQQLSRSLAIAKEADRVATCASLVQSYQYITHRTFIYYHNTTLLAYVICGWMM